MPSCRTSPLCLRAFVRAWISARKVDPCDSREDPVVCAALVGANVYVDLDDVLEAERDFWKASGSLLPCLFHASSKEALLAGRARDESFRRNWERHPCLPVPAVSIKTGMFREELDAFIGII